MNETLQLKHPAGKKAVSMDQKKYDSLKEPLLRQLRAKGESTHGDIVRAILDDFERNETKFEGSVPWHTEWVKLDLEARKVIRRIPGTSPIKYELSAA